MSRVVCNYNRRSAAITDFLRRLILVAAFNFYDDKYGFEPEATAVSAIDPKKLQQSTPPTMIGVTHDLASGVLLLKPDRRPLCSLGLQRRRKSRMSGLPGRIRLLWWNFCHRCCAQGFPGLPAR